MPGEFCGQRSLAGRWTTVHEVAKKKGISEGTLALIIVLVAVAIAAAAVITVLILSTADESKPNTSETQASAIPADTLMTEVKAAINSHKTTDFTETQETTEYVKISVKDHGDIVIRLRSDVAPETVKNFQELVARGFYDGLTFHRIYKNFMIQGGDPKGDGTGDAGKDIKGEFTSNGFTNNLQHIRGVISMARGNEPDSASCQFFICDATSEHLDGKYASFGYVMAGMETVDSIAAVEVQANAKGEKSDPIEDVIIEKIVFVKDSHNH